MPTSHSCAVVGFRLPIICRNKVSSCISIDSSQYQQTSTILTVTETHYLHRQDLTFEKQILPLFFKFTYRNHYDTLVIPMSCQTCQVASSIGIRVNYEFVSSQTLTCACFDSRLIDILSSGGAYPCLLSTRSVLRYISVSICG